VGLAVHGDVWHRAAFYALGAGLLFAAVAALFGVVDWVRLPRGRGKTIAFGHGWLMLATAMLYFLAWVLRYNRPEDPSNAVLGLSVAAFVLLVGSAYRGSRVVSIEADSSQQRSDPLIGGSR
jgi:uncharacterized membrane protein